MVAWRHGIPVAYWLRPGRPPPRGESDFYLKKPRAEARGSSPISGVTGHRGYGLGAARVSFKMRKRRETGNDYAKRGQRRRAARFHQSFPRMVLDGYSREALRPPQPAPKAGHQAAFPSFLYFERDPRGPSGVPSPPVSSKKCGTQCDGKRGAPAGRGASWDIASWIDRIWATARRT